MRNVLLYLLFLPLISCQLEKPEQKPNIILIYADDLGRGMLGAWGQEIITTPNIDRLADEGMKFSRAYGCQFCAPARASLITGMHDCHEAEWSLTRPGIYIKEAHELNLAEIANKIHAISMPAREDEMFLGQVAQVQGYITAQFGKLEWGFATTARRMQRHGWDYHFGYYDHRKCHGFYPPYLFENGEVMEIPGNTHVDAAKTFDSESPANYAKRWDMDGKKVYSQDIIMEKLLGFIEQNNPNKTQKPFFIYFPTQLPHGPISVPEVHPDLQDIEELTEFEKEYATMVKILDDDVGEIRAKLKKLGLLDNTIIIFTGDNGHEVYTRQEGRTENSKARLGGGKFDNIESKFYSEINGDVFDGNDGMAGLKRDNWEGGVRVPLIWFWKGKIRAGTECDEIVANYDLLNTIAELTGGVEIKGKDSRSYMQTLLGESGSVHDYIVYSSQFGPAIVTNEGWKLRCYSKEDVFQLYYLPDDYREEKVLNEEYPEKVESLKSILLEECEGDWENGGYPKFVNPLTDI